MSFWDSFKRSQYAYREFSNSMRGRSSSFSSIDQSINQLHKWKYEFESLDSEARMERDPFDAINRLSGVLNQITNRIDGLLVLRTRLIGDLQKIRERIKSLEESIVRTQDSLRYDSQKINNMRDGEAKRNLYRKFAEKDDKLINMRSLLLELQIKQKSIDPGY